MRWPDDATDWPMADHSRMVLHRPHRWHVQEAGTGPTILLLHGAGGATQSWRGVFPLLAKDFHVIALDLPGQGFSQSGARHRSGLNAMAEDIASLAADQNWHPTAIIGHSAGAAIALRLSELLTDPVPRVVGLNAALSNFKGIAGWLFPMLAKVLAISPFTADVFAATASSPASVRRLVAGTGSSLPSEGLDLYRRLISDRSHVDGTLAMMAQWQLDDLLSRLGTITAPTLLLAGENDRSVPPATSRTAAAQMPNARFEPVPGLGHLMHEEDPDKIVALITPFLAG